jgi:hypothetical protein
VLCTLLARCRLELHDQFGGYPAAILHFNALGLGPLAYLGGVQPARRSPARAARRPPASAADLCVPIISSTSCDQVIFVDQATDVCLFPDAVQIEINRFG